MTMETIIKKANELADVLKNSEIVRDYKAAHAAYTLDTTAQDLIGQFNLARMTLMNESQNETPDPQRMEQLEQKVQNAYQAVMALPVMQQVEKTGKIIDDMMAQINQILQAAITGESSGCNHDCKSCGGCH